VLGGIRQLDAVAGLGPRVRELRRERGFTLKDLGRRAGLSHPFLSQLERGLARPSVESVERIAEALGVPVGSLWAPPRHGEACVVRAGPAAPGEVLRRVSPAGETLQVHEWSGGPEWTEPARSRGGAMVVYVIRGALELDLGGRVHTLKAGDTLHFDGCVPHRMRRAGRAAARALVVTSA